ncbi:hypothetical protein [Roseimicrobium gellanilyticum]|nr:hypothetical protein [Roseimicrobium gellanilyticum]
MKFSLRVIWLSLLLLGGTALIGREWKNGDGRTLEAEMLGVEKDRAVVMLPNRQRANLRIADLSEADQSWVKEWATGKSTLQALPPPPPWPANIQQPPIFVKDGGSSEGEYTFSSKHYDFVCDAEMSTAVMNDFATVAEGTIKLLHSLPVTFPSLEGRTLQARIVRSRENYARAGGPEGSAGVFISNGRGEGVLLVPFESLGIVNFMGKNTKGDGYKATVLIHEMAHQITSDLIPLMPRWMTEGIAEYAAMIPYRSGVFYLGERERVLAMRQRIEFYQQLTRAGVDFSGQWVMKPSELVKTRSEEWDTTKQGHDALIALHRLYISSMYFVHYLMHLADNGDARRIRNYFHVVGDGSRWLRTRGREGSLPPEVEGNERASLEEVRAMFLKSLFAPDELDAIDADFEAKYRALGVGLR